MYIENTSSDDLEFTLMTTFLFLFKGKVMCSIESTKVYVFVKEGVGGKREGVGEEKLRTDLTSGGFTPIRTESTNE